MPVDAVVAFAGFIASFLSGLLGIGGGIVLTPVLLYAPQLVGAPALSVKIITGLTVVQAVSASVLGALRHRAYGNVSTRLVLLMGPPAAIASLFGAFVSRDVSDQLLLAIYAVFSFLGAVFLLSATDARGGDAGRARERTACGVPRRHHRRVRRHGGHRRDRLHRRGPRVLPARAAACGHRELARDRAVRRDRGVLGKAATAQVDPKLAAIVVAAAVVGSPLGSWVSVRMRTDLLLRSLALLVGLAAVRIAWSAVGGG